MTKTLRELFDFDKMKLDEQNRLDEAKSKSKKVDVNALGQALNNDWGKSSTTNSHFYSVKGNIHGKFVILSFTMIVNFVDELSLEAMKKDCEKESKKITNDALKEIKKAYKEKASVALNLKEVDSSTSVEYISVSNAKKTAYFRRVTRYELT